MNTGGPVAIGGIGGSGTRVGAALLQRLGRYIGSDLNDAYDNLWFTLLFKRRSILLEQSTSFGRLADLFWAKMGGGPPFDRQAIDAIAALGTQGRIQHDADWLQDRVQTWIHSPPASETPWGWKEPNTHLIIDRLFDLKDDLRYVHLVRNPLDMALSSNQNQLENWGPVLLNRPVEIGPRDSLSYCCAVARRVEQLAVSYPGRVYKFDFDLLIHTPEEACRQFAGFIGTGVDANTITWFADLVRSGTPESGRSRNVNHNVFATADLNFVSELGYDL